MSFRKKSYDSLNDCKTYDDLKKYIKTLLNQNLSSEKKLFIKELQEWNEEVVNFDYLKNAIKFFEQLIEFENKFESIKQEIENNSILKNESNNKNSSIRHKYQAIEKKLNDFKERIASHKCVLGGYTEHKANLVENAFKEYEKERNAIKIKYPDSYFSITQNIKKKLEGPQSLYQITSLFEDYYKKNCILFFHMRKQTKEAKAINTELNAILHSKKTDAEKIEGAISVILTQKNEITKKRDLCVRCEKESSFFRRANFAIELLDKERANLNSLKLRA